MRTDNTSGRTNLHHEKATDFWCADIRVNVDGERKRYRKRSKDRAEAEAWLDAREHELGCRA